MGRHKPKLADPGQHSQTQPSWASRLTRATQADTASRLLANTYVSRISSSTHTHTLSRPFGPKVGPWAPRSAPTAPRIHHEMVFKHFHHARICFECYDKGERYRYHQGERSGCSAFSLLAKLQFLKTPWVVSSGTGFY